MTGVMSTLRADHRNMTQLLDVLDAQFQMLEEGGSPDYEVVSGIMEYCLNYPDLYHHPKEDIVYRALRARRPEAAEKMGNLETLHAELGDLTRRLAAAVRQVLSGAEMDRGSVVGLAKEFTASYRHHIEMEEEHFFPVAENLLIAEDWADIQSDLRVADDPIFGVSEIGSLQDLRRRVLQWHGVGSTA